MNPRQKNIIEVLKLELSPEELYVENESDQHSGPPGRESHFKIIGVSSLFDKKNRVERHQMVYKLLQSELDSGLHALALKLFTPAEWLEKKGHITLTSPNCSGKNK